MSSRYILSPDGTVKKYNNDPESEEFGTIETDNALSTTGKAAFYEDVIQYASEDIDGFGVNKLEGKLNTDVGLGTGWDDNPEVQAVKKDLFIQTQRNESFDFDIERKSLSSDESNKLRSYKPFNSFTNNIANNDKMNPSVFADEFEILSGMRFREGENQTKEILFSLFTYFASSIIRLFIVEGIILINRLLNFANGEQYRTAERYTLRIGKYDYTEFDIFTKYIYDVLNYPHESSSILERVSAYFIGFAEWLAPDSAINLKEIARETTTDSNDLDFLSSLMTKGDNREIFLGLNDTPLAIVYAAITVAVSSATNQASNKRVKLLFRKFFQEKHWKDDVLYTAKEAESSVDDIFADLNYYYFRFYIERIQVGLKIIKKYIYDESYLPGRAKDSSFNRVSAQRSNRHIDYGIQILDFGGQKLLASDLGDIKEMLGRLKEAKDKKAAIDNTLATGQPDAALTAKAKAEQNKIDAINSVLPDWAKVENLVIPENHLNYDWQNKHSDGNFKASPTRNKKPGQTTRLRALPQLFTLHKSLYKALLANGKKSVSLEKSLIQNFYGGTKAGHSERRIPSFVVSELENVLEAEYMPFYFHDVRTNELLSFHAFIDSITDSFNPEYNSASGFGRIDDVRSYIKTTRNLNLTFTIAATSETDHDLMWYQINKLVAMVYPQWSAGYSALEKDAAGKDIPATDFKFPFTQVPTASPLIRLRVGDVIKSNYSRTNLSRLHGVGERTSDADITANIGEDHLELMPGLYRLEALGSIGLEVNHGPRSIKLDSPVPVATNNIATMISDNKDTAGDFYQVTIENPYFKEFNPVDLLKIPPGIPAEKTITVIADASKIIVKDTKTLASAQNPDPQVSADTIMKSFVDSKSNNPITGSYESGMSRGLAGFITQLDVNYNEVNWETSRIGSKAPILVKITINFAPIHDIPPGLDHNGMLRAPVYNVGRINNQFFGDPQDREYSGSGHDRALAKYKFLRNKNSLRYKDDHSGD